MWTSNTGGQAFTWCPSSETWTSRKSPQEKSWNIEFIDTNKQLRNAASRRQTARCTRIVTLRQTLKTALRHGWLDRLPDFSEPYRLSSKISYRPSFSPSLIAPVRNPLPSEGSKQVNLGRTRFIYDTSRFLLTAVDLPIVSWVAEATEEVP